MMPTASLDPAITARPAPAPRPRPINLERPFALDEIFFSTTDPKGVIRSGNRVFARVSEYPLDQMIGHPHNLIRHPDMPRAAFRLMWDEIQAGRPFAAYVKNMARDGAYYWVLATIVACPGGYLSIRIKPSTPYFDVARSVYPELVAVERGVEDGDPHRRQAAIAAGGERLQERLHAAGYAGYEPFMRAALLAEVKSREAQVGTAGRRGLDVAPPDADPALVGVLRACAAVSHFVDGLVARLSDYSALYERLSTRTTFVLELAEDVQLFALNAQIATPRLGAGGRTLAAVAEQLRARSRAGHAVFQALAGDVAGSLRILDAMFLPVAVTRLQTETIMVFIHELLDGAGARATVADLGALASCLTDSVTRLETLLGELSQRLTSLGAHVLDLEADMKAMRALEINGRIEAARIGDSLTLLSLFSAIAGRTVTARKELSELGAAGRLDFVTDAAAARRALAEVRTIPECLHTLGAAA